MLIEPAPRPFCWAKAPCCGLLAPPMSWGLKVVDMPKPGLSDWSRLMDMVASRLNMKLS